MSRAAFRLTDARGIPDLPTNSLVSVGRRPLIWAMLVTLFITDVAWSARVGLSIGGWGITIGVVGGLLALRQSTVGAAAVSPRWPRRARAGWRSPPLEQCSPISPR